MIYSLVIDTWLGQGPVDVAALDGVSGGIARLNSCNGLLKRDPSFDAAWKSYERLPARGLYFVYHPDMTGFANHAFLEANAPLDCTAFFVDVEIRPLSHDGGFVAAQLAEFVKRFRAIYPDALLCIYTGGWFIPEINYWPRDVDYWYSRYPYALYPDPKQLGLVKRVSWDWVRMAIDAFDASQPAGAWAWMRSGSQGSNAFRIGPVKLWQAMADRHIVPGSDHIMDINIFPGSVDELRAWFKMTGTPPVIIPAELTIDEKVSRLWAAHPELHDR